MKIDAKLMYRLLFRVYMLVFSATKTRCSNKLWEELKELSIAVITFLMKKKTAYIGRGQVSVPRLRFHSC